MLLTTKATDEQVSGLESQIKSFISEQEGNLASFDKWGRYRLAYQIRKQDYGTYILARYELSDPDAFFKSFENFIRVKCHEFVMRHVNVALTPEEFARPYSKPISLDAQPEGEGQDRRRGRSPRFGAGAPRAQAPKEEKTEEAPVAADVEVASDASEQTSVEE